MGRDSSKAALHRCSCFPVQSVRGAATDPKVCIIQTEPGREGWGERKDIGERWTALSGCSLLDLLSKLFSDCNPRPQGSPRNSGAAVHLTKKDLLRERLHSPNKTFFHLFINQFSGLKRRMLRLLWVTKCSVVPQIIAQRAAGATLHKHTDAAMHSITLGTRLGQGMENNVSICLKKSLNHLNYNFWEICIYTILGRLCLAYCVIECLLRLE